MSRMKNVDEKVKAQIVNDVLADWLRPTDQATIRRRWPKLIEPAAIIEAEVRQRIFFSSCPSSPKPS